MTKKSQLPLVYRGSVKNIRLVAPPKKNDPGRYLFEFTDDYSVFDYGKMPDRIRGKGSVLAMMTAYLFESLACPSDWKALFSHTRLWDQIGDQALRRRLMKSSAGKRLRDQGLATHYLGLLDSQGRIRKMNQLNEPTNKIVVKAVPVVSPKPLALGGGTIWDYSVFHPALSQCLIPLENIFRFGVPKGSSLLDRLRKNPNYGRQIGLKDIPREGEWLPFPVIEFSSKLEPSDRILPIETALNFSGLSGPEFQELADLSLLVAVFLYNLFLEKDLNLWDGKFEFIKTNKTLLLADSITPDELRITFRNTQLSKEPLRQYYKKQDPQFNAVIKSIKEEGPLAGSIRKEIKNRLGRPPKKLDDSFKHIVEQMYQALVYRVTGSSLFARSMELETIVEHLNSL